MKRTRPEAGTRRFAGEGAVVLCAVLAAGCTSSGSGSGAWPVSTPEEQGIDSVALAEIIEAIDRENLPVDSLLVARNGALVLDAYFYPYLGDRPHDVASVTKSVTSTLIGIAVDDGLLEVDQPIVSFFPELDASKHDIEVGHLLSMSSGLACGIAAGEQELNEMMRSENFVEYALDLPLLLTPGTAFAYCSPGSHLLSAIVTKMTGMSALALARERLFGPLGIVDSTWPADPQGVSRGWGDLQLQPRDMARIGQLFLNGGEWRGKQIVSAEWVEQATRTVISAGEDGTGYGYQWWILPAPLDGIYEAQGRGGQAIDIWPDNGLIVVFTGRGVDVRGDIAPLLLAALKGEEPIAPSPDGNERLAQAIAKAAEPPQAQPVPELPSAANAMSGKLYRLDDNPFDARCVRLRFSSKFDVEFELTTSGGAFQMPVGMDGVPRFSDDSPTGIPIGLVGAWTSPDVFLLLYDEVGGPNHLRVVVQVPVGANTIEVEFSDPGEYFPTTTVDGAVVEQCD